jgi:U4/U6.U5 tri-snRNP-associated protein 2
VQRTAELTAKVWNPRSFKGHVSPHELLQAVMTSSNKKFKVGQHSDPRELLSWFLNTVHRDLGGTKQRKSSIIYQTFQGEIQVTTEKDWKVLEKERKVAEKKAKEEREKKALQDRQAGGSEKKDEKSTKDEKYMDTAEDGGFQPGKDGRQITVTKTPFLCLTLDLPSAPLFKDAQEKTLIPNIPLFDLLAKFDGVTEELLPDGTKKKYKITKLPRYLMIHIKRFQENNWFTEKNPTLVNFPITNLDMKPYTLIKDPPTLDELKKLSVAELKQRLKKRKVEGANVTEKNALIAKLVESYENATIPTKYNLIANICHEGKFDKGAYKIHVYHKPKDTWYEMQDLHVWTTETMPQLVALSETYIQIYELKRG